ncbi:signal peptidase II [Candidatus Pelagibacter sp.]|nr:signal peptidase II [Candidatus Pelagibacter sp.]
MIFKNLSKNFYISLIIITFIFILDRVLKVLVINLDQIKNGFNIPLTSFLNIDLVWNQGIAFGFLSFSEKNFYNIITLIILLIIIFIIFLIYKNNGFKKYSYILVCGGALGNVFDRMYYQSVPDFIDIHYNSFHWFIFNVADIFITIGVICLIFDEIFLERYRNE